jgi:hypothetical protein
VETSASSEARYAPLSYPTARPCAFNDCDLFAARWRFAALLLIAHRPVSLGNGPTKGLLLSFDTPVDSGSHTNRPMPATQTRTGR